MFTLTVLCNTSQNLKLFSSKNGSPVAACDVGAVVATVTKKRRGNDTANIEINVGELTLSNRSAISSSSTVKRDAIELVSDPQTERQRSSHGLLLLQRNRRLGRW